MRLKPLDSIGLSSRFRGKLLPLRLGRGRFRSVSERGDDGLFAKEVGVVEI